MLVAILLIVVGLHVTGPSQYFLIAGGALLVLMVVLTDGPLSAWELMGRGTHRRADWIAIVALAAMPAIPGRTLLSAILLEASAVGLWRLTTWTRFEPRPSWRQRRAPVAANATSVPEAPVQEAVSRPSIPSTPSAPSAPSTPSARSVPTVSTAPSSGSAPAPSKPAASATPTGLAPDVDLALRRTVRKAGIAAGVIRRRRMRS